MLGILVVDYVAVPWKRLPLQQQVVEYNPTQGDLPDNTGFQQDCGTENPEDSNQEAEGIFNHTSSPRKSVAKYPLVLLLVTVRVGLHHPCLESEGVVSNKVKRDVSVVVRKRCRIWETCSIHLQGSMKC